MNTNDFTLIMIFYVFSKKFQVVCFRFVDRVKADFLRCGKREKSTADDFEDIMVKIWKISKVWLLKTVEDIVAKGKIARFKQVLLLSQCFQKSSAAEASESVYMRERVKEISILLFSILIQRHTFISSHVFNAFMS